MGILSWLKREERADNTVVVTVADALLTALMGGKGVTKETALQVPTVAGGVDLIANVVASTPVKLYRDRDGKAEEVRDDRRLRLLNDDPGDTLSAHEFWRAIVRDYYLGKGGYAYINRQGGRIQSLHYVDEAQISIVKNTDPIFKDFDFLVQGRRYKPFEFVKILRNTKDGATGSPITDENEKLIETAYISLLLELSLAKRGGNKKGFLMTDKTLTDQAIKELRKNFNRFYRDDGENFVTLNKGITFAEANNTSVEMQLNQNKKANAEEFSKIFHVSTDVLSGKASETDIASLARLSAIPLMTAIQCALNKDLLLEREKSSLYFAFDTKELLKGDMQTRFNAYKTALDANFMQIDEVRYSEDLKPLGMTWVKLGLNDVLYNPETKTIYTPNTNKTSMMGDEALPEPDEDGTIDEAKEMVGAWEEQRANPNHDPKNGQFASGKGGAKTAKTKYSPSQRRNSGGITVGNKKYSKLCGTFNTRYPGLKEGEVRTINDAKYRYRVKADGYGGMTILQKKKI
jgi:HK97 family phage portal protein